MINARLERANLSYTHLEGANLSNAILKGTNLSYAHMEGTILSNTHLEGAYLRGASLGAALLAEEDFQRILRAKQENGIHVPKRLPPANLRNAFFDKSTQLDNTKVGDKTTSIHVADVRWGDVNLAVIPWQIQQIRTLGDEDAARQIKDTTRQVQTDTWESAIRAYRQLAVALRNQGINELADQFAYRGQLCQRRLLRLQRRFGRYIWSGFLDALAGYGFQPLRTFGWYLVVILGFTGLYMLFGTINNHAFTFHEGIIFSLTSFHGRGFFPGGIALDDPITTIAAIEAFVGLIIEISFIATFTQRYFVR